MLTQPSVKSTCSVDLYVHVTDKEPLQKHKGHYTYHVEIKVYHHKFFFQRENSFIS